MNRFRKWLFGLLMFEVSRVEVKPGDVIVFRHSKKLSPDDRVHILTEMRRVFPGNSYALADEGSSIELVRCLGGDDGKSLIEANL